MRPTISKQLGLFAPAVSHELATELAEVDAVIRAHPEWVGWVHADLTKNRGVDGTCGRTGMAAAHVMRVVLLKHRLNVSLRKLSPLLADSLSLREFVGWLMTDPTPKRATLQDNVVLVKPETWGRILQALARSSEAQEHETGEKVRIDATVTKSNIHAPFDSSLLWDCVRVLTRLMTQSRADFAIEFVDHSRLAKRLQQRIFYAHAKAERVPAYRSLLAVAEQVNEQAAIVLAALRSVGRLSEEWPAREGLAAEIEEYRVLFVRVIDQTRRRVIQGETVPAREKVFSIFEPHTDIIVKSKTQPPEYGHKVTLTAGESGMVLDCVVERGNPVDTTLAIRQLQRQKELLGRAPETAVFDGGYASRENFEQAKALGVERCVFSKGRGLTAVEMAGSRRSFGRLRNFRAGVEGIVSYLKCAFGLDRCTWKGWRRFQSYVWSAVLAANLTTLARRRLCAT